MTDYRETFTGIGAERITPNDSGSITGVRGINVEVSGLVYVDTEDGDSNVPVYISAGGIFSLAVTRIYSTGTTATGITVIR